MRLINHLFYINIKWGQVQLAPIASLAKEIMERLFEEESIHSGRVIDASCVQSSNFIEWSYFSLHISTDYRLCKR